MHKMNAAVSYVAGQDADPPLSPGRAVRLFWIALFLPVNLLFQPLWFALLSISPPMDSPLGWTTFVKLSYFLSVCWAVLLLAKIWPSLKPARSRAITWAYRLIGLASVTALLVAHAPRMYQFGRPERDLFSEIRRINKTLPLQVGPGIRLDATRLGKSEIAYEYTLTGAEVLQLDRRKIQPVIFNSVKNLICRDEKQTKLLAQGVWLHYAYRERNGRLLAAFSLGQRSCAGGAG
jgi:hypothetical protein